MINDYYPSEGKATRLVNTMPEMLFSEAEIMKSWNEMVKKSKQPDLKVVKPEPE